MTAAAVEARACTGRADYVPERGPWDHTSPVLLAGAIVMGGGVWNFGDVALALVGLALIGCAWWRQHTRRELRWGPVEWTTLGAFALLAVTQLVPLPPSWLEGFPGRDVIAGDLRVAGVGSAWRPWSLDVSGAIRSLGALLPSVAMFLLVGGASDVAIGRACRVLVGMGCVAVALGVAQVLDGPDSSMRLHGFHNRIGALGFFAYRNAFATALVMTLPFAAALLLLKPATAGRRDASHRWVWGGAMTWLLIGVMLTYSRAGAMLAALAICGCGLLYARDGRRPGRWFIGIAALAAAVTAGAFAAQALLGRAGASLRDDARWDLYREVMATAAPYHPWGAGLGSFELVFQSSSLNLTYVDAYMNRAHNDWAQLLFELGWPGLIVAIAVAALTVHAAWRAWAVKLRASASPSFERVLFARAASIAIVLALSHSYFDYPLRTGSNLVVFAFAAGILWRSHRAVNTRIPLE